MHKWGPINLKNEVEMEMTKTKIAEVDGRKTNNNNQPVQHSQPEHGRKKQWQ